MIALTEDAANATNDDLLLLNVSDDTTMDLTNNPSLDLDGELDDDNVTDIHREPCGGCTMQVAVEHGVEVDGVWYHRVHAPAPTVTPPWERPEYVSTIDAAGPVAVIQGLAEALDILRPESREKRLGRALSLVSNGYTVMAVRITVDPTTGANTKSYPVPGQSHGADLPWGATANLDVVRQWWAEGSQYADCMPGIITEHSGVVVIDLDVKHDQDGPGEWARMHPEPYPMPAAVAVTSTGGRHLAYRADPTRPAKTCAGELAPGVDVRAVGGMVVAWGGWLPKVGDLPMVPDVVCELAPHRAPTIPAPRTAPITAAASDAVVARVWELADEIAAAPEGSGERTVNDVAFKVGQYVGAGQLDEAEAVTILVGALSGWTWRAASDRHKITNKVGRAVRDGMGQPRAWEATTPVPDVTVLDVSDLRIAPDTQVATTAAATGGGRGEAATAAQMIGIVRDELSLWRSPEGRIYGTTPSLPGHALAHGTPSELMSAVKMLWSERHAGAWPNSKACTQTVDYIETMGALAPVQPAPLRSDYDREVGRIVIDLGAAEVCRRMISVTAHGWEIVTADRPFRRSPQTAQLATPTHGGDLSRLWGLVPVAAEDRPLVLAALITALMTGVAQPVVLMAGAQDAGKTETSRFLLRIIDPVTVKERGGSLPATDGDWKSRASSYRCILIDNASGITAAQSDSLCKVATGGEATSRQLYTDDTAHITSMQAPVWMTSIGVGALRGDLASRMLRIELQALSRDRRVALSELRAAQDEALPAITGGLLDLMVGVLAALPTINRTRLTSRLTDFELVLRCIEQIQGGSGTARMESMADDLTVEVLEGDPVAMAIIKGTERISDGVVRFGPEMIGMHTPTKLLETITAYAGESGRSRSWPKTPRVLSDHLMRIAPALERSHGIVIERVKSNGVRVITLRKA